MCACTCMCVCIYACVWVGGCVCVFTWPLLDWWLPVVGLSPRNLVLAVFNLNFPSYFYSIQPIQVAHPPIQLLAAFPRVSVQSYSLPGVLWTLSSIQTLPVLSLDTQVYLSFYLRLSKSRVLLEVVTGQCTSLSSRRPWSPTIIHTAALCYLHPVPVAAFPSFFSALSHTQKTSSVWILHTSICLGLRCTSWTLTYERCETRGGMDVLLWYRHKHLTAPPITSRSVSNN